MRRLPFLLPVTFAVLSVVALATAPDDFEPLNKEAEKNYSSKEGREYFDKFEKAIAPVFIKALRECGDATPDTKESMDLFFIVGADGTVKKFLYSKGTPFAECLGPKLTSIKTVPPPPRDGWVVALGATNHRHETPKGPPDRPVNLSKEGFSEYEKAIAPYIAKARATYPAAKERFLAGLPKGERLYVRTPLIDSTGKREDSFVQVESIKDGAITGLIASELTVVGEFKQGQRLTIPEAKIDNWLISHPDGTEEGNEVGKFLDTYQPK
jgi:hypothetical protein